jgi:hypothetical protein
MKVIAESLAESISAQRSANMEHALSIADKGDPGARRRFQCFAARRKAVRHLLEEFLKETGDFLRGS